MPACRLVAGMARSYDSPVVGWARVLTMLGYGCSGKFVWTVGVAFQYQ